MAQKIRMTEQASGVLPVANGGTGTNDLSTLSVGTAAVSFALRNSSTDVSTVSALAPIPGQYLVANSSTSAIWKNLDTWGSSWKGATGTGFSISLDNSYAAGGIGQSIAIGNTQTNALTGLSINTGTSSVGHTGLLINATGASTSQKGISVTLGTTGTGTGIDIIQGGGNITNYGIRWQTNVNTSGSGTKYGISFAGIASSGGTGYGIHMATISGGGGSNAVGWQVDQLDNSGVGTTGGKFFSLNANSSFGSAIGRTTNAGEILVTRQTGGFTGTANDNYSVLNISRTTSKSGSGTMTAAGSVLSLSNATSGTTSDTVTPLSVVQGAGSQGVPVSITQNAVVSTNYRKLITETVTGITIWMGNGTTANGNLSGTAGDILFNGGLNKPEYCTGTTNWVALV